MDILTFLLCSSPLAIGSVWVFGAMIRTLGKRKRWNPQRTFWISVLLYGLLGYVTPAVLYFLPISYNDAFLYWMFIFTVLAPIYLIVNGVLNRQERQKAKSVKLVTEGQNSHSYSSILKDQQPMPKQSSEKAGVVGDLDVGTGGTVSEAGSSHIFISYRRSDSADVAGRIYDRLIGRFGKGPVFKDVDSIPLGLDFKEYLDQKVGECDVLLAIIGDRWLDALDSAGKNRLDDPTDFVRIEIEAALERGIPIIPLLVRGAEMPRAERLPPGLRKLAYRNGIPVRADPDFHRDMDRLISALEKYVR